MRKENIIRDKKGVFELPMQYIVAIIVSVIVILLIGVAAQNMYRESQLKDAIREVNRMVAEAEMMYSTGEEGTKIVMDINLPHTVREVILGSSEKSLAGEYCIIMDWGEKWRDSTERVRFTGENEGKAILYGGTKKVMLHLIREGDEKYVEIYPVG